MTLRSIVDELYGSFGSRYQAERPLFLRYVDIAQKAAFNRGCRAFVRTAELNEGGDFPEDAREIISVSYPSYEIDTFRRKVIFGVTPVYPVQVRYYIKPETLTGTEAGGGAMEFSEEDEAKVIVPDEWRWQILAEPAIALMDSGLYGDKAPQQVLEGYFREWWQAMDARPPDRKPMDSAGAW
jgi:hypothetical protein